MSNKNLLALLLLSGCSSADFTTVHHGAMGGAPGSGAGKNPSGDSVSGAPNATGGRSAAGGATQLPASAGHASVSSSGAEGSDVARAGSSSQAGEGSSGMSAGNAGSASLGGIGGHLSTDTNGAGTPAVTAGRSASGGAPAFGGASGTRGASGGVEPIGGCNHQLLVNADFEAGPGLPWQESSDWPGVTIVVPASAAGLQKESVLPYGGNYLAWLGGIPDNPYDHYEVTLTQAITIPATTAELTLSGEYLVHSEDGAEGAYDEAHLQLNVADEVGWLAQSFTNQDMGHDWKSFSAQTTDLDGLRGKTVTFIAYSRTDLDGKTSFWLDDLRLQATCGR